MSNQRRTNFLLSGVQDALSDFQNGPKIARPSVAQSFIPIVGPAWEAAGDLQDGDYAGAAFNGAMAIADALPVGIAAKGFRAMSKGVGVLKKGSTTANASQKLYRNRLKLTTEEEVHHSIPLDGIKRNVPHWKNHNAFLKRLPKEQHRRLTGSWGKGVDRKPMYDPIRKAWYGTTDWQKAALAGPVVYGGDAAQNWRSSQDFEQGGQR